MNRTMVILWRKVEPQTAKTKLSLQTTLQEMRKLLAIAVVLLAKGGIVPLQVLLPVVVTGVVVVPVAVILVCPATITAVKVQAEIPPVKIHVEILPVKLRAEIAPVKLRAEIPPVKLHAEIPPLKLHAEILPVKLHAEIPPVKLQAEIPLVHKTVVITVILSLIRICDTCKFQYCQWSFKQKFL